LLPPAQKIGSEYPSAETHPSPLPRWHEGVTERSVVVWGIGPPGLVGTGRYHA
jgi:hypothetical protein